MKKEGKWILFFLYLLLFSSPVGGEELPFSLEAVTYPSSLLPQETATLSFLVTNLTPEEKNFQEEVELPSGWLLLFPVGSFILPGGEKEVRLVSFQVPLSTPAGDYEIIYRVREEKEVTTLEEKVKVSILPVLEIAIFPVRYPAYVVGGESYEITFSLQNKSNVPLNLTLEGEAADGYPLSVDKTTFSLSPGESTVVQVQVETEAKINRSLKHWVKLKAKATSPQGETIEKESRSWVDIIPKVSGETDLYHRLPATLKIERGGKGGWGVEFSGEGTLEEGGKDKVAFSFITPYFREGSSSGQYAYDLSYENESTGVYLGDRSFYLSPLTRYHTYGRGIEIHLLEEKEFSFQGFYLQRSDGEKVGALSLIYSQEEEEGLALHYLSSGGGDMVSLEGKGNLGEVEVEAEVAQGIPEGEAWRLKFSGEGEKWEGGGSFLSATADFPGSVYDMVQRSLWLSFSPEDKLKVWGRYFEQEENLSRDTRRSSAPARETQEVGLTYKMGGELSISHLLWERKDLLFPPDYSSQEDLIRLSYGDSWDDCRTRLYYEWGKKEDYLKGEEQAVANWGLSLSYSRDDWDAEAFYSQGVGRFTEVGEVPRSSWGINAQYQVSEEVGAELFFRQSEREGYDPYRYLSLGVSYALPNGNMLELSGRQTFSESFKDGSTDLFLTYSIPLGIAVSKKKNIGTVQGRVYEELHPQEGIEGVILRANGIPAVTDEEGKFIFPSLVVGDYYLEVDRATLGIGRIPTVKTPLLFSIQEGEKKEIDIGVVEAASIRGRVAFFGPQEEGLLQKEEAPLVEKGGWGGVTVVAKSDDETYFAVADREGYFQFPELLPKNWNLYIADALPPHYYLEEKTISLTLEPGEKRELPLWRVLPEKREVILLEEETLF
ncbi:MAG: hypothetical protein PWP57_1022 [Candidatus Atribacteria bacterium]|nr:hypothetical protein [Candidatus Atribacteria bacterium]